MCAKIAVSIAVLEITKPLLMWGKSKELVLTVGEAGHLDNIKVHAGKMLNFQMKLACPLQPTSKNVSKD